MPAPARAKQRQDGEQVQMKRVKGRIILGTAAVAAALTISGCSGNQNASQGTQSCTAVTAQGSTQEASGTEKTEEESGADMATTVLDYEKFDVNDNYNNVVYGPPPE